AMQLGLHEVPVTILRRQEAGRGVEVDMPGLPSGDEYFPENARPSEVFGSEAVQGTMEPEAAPPSEVTPGGPVGSVGPAGEGTLEGAPSEDVPAARGERPTGGRPVRGPGTDGGRDGGPDRARGELVPSLGTDPGRVAVPAERGGRAGTRQRPDDLATAAKRGSPSEPGGRNVHLTLEQAAEIAEGGPKTKFRNNVEAIRLMKQLIAEGRPP